MNPFSLFGLLSLFYAWVGLRALVESWRERDALFDARVTARDRYMLDRLAFFAILPFGVLIHEVGHALAVWQVGGEVVEFRWLLYFGYVLPRGDFSALQGWWISLAGNLAGLAVGLVGLAALPLLRSQARSYLVWSAARLQLYYSLVFYPVFSVLTGFGDWVGIYAAILQRAPILSSGRIDRLAAFTWLTLALHLALGGGLWALMRSYRFRTWLVGRYAPEAEASPLAIVARDADTAEDLNELGAHYARQGEWRLAERAFREAEAMDPTDIRPLLNQGRVASLRGRHDRSLELYGRALDLAGSPALRRLALVGLAEAELEHRRPQAALAHAERALAETPGQEDPALRLFLGRLRALVGDRDGAREAMRRAMDGADPDLSRELAEELEQLERDAR